MSRRLRSDRRGATAAEFALVVPVFMSVIFAVIDIAALLYARNTLQFAVEEAGRFALASSTATNDAIKNRANAYLTRYGTPVTCCTSVTESGVVYREINASYSYDWLLPGIPATVLTARYRVPPAAG